MRIPHGHARAYRVFRIDAIAEHSMTTSMNHQIPL